MNSFGFLTKTTLYSVFVWLLKIEGTFKLDTPPVMIGYKKDPKLSQINSFLNPDANIAADKPVRESSYLSLYVTIEPQLLVPDVYREGYDTIESQEVIDKVAKWANTLRSKYTNRDFHPVVMNSDGKSVLITRYLRPIEPPAELKERDASSFETAVIIFLVFIKNLL